MYKLCRRCCAICAARRRGACPHINYTAPRRRFMPQRGGENKRDVKRRCTPLAPLWGSCQPTADRGIVRCGVGCGFACKRRLMQILRPNPSGSANADPPPFTQGRQRANLYSALSFLLCLFLLSGDCQYVKDTAPPDAKNPPDHSGGFLQHYLFLISSHAGWRTGRRRCRKAS